MWADKDKVVRIAEEGANRRNFSATRLLAGSKGIEADHDQRVARVQNGVIERNLRAVVADAFDLDNRAAGLRGCLRDELGEIRLHDVIQEPPNALIETRRIGEFLKSGVEQPTAFEQRWEAIFNDRERRPYLSRAAPGVVEGELRWVTFIEPGD